MDALQLFLQLALSLGMGGLISGMSYLSVEKLKWDNRKFAFSLIVSTFTSLTVVSGITGGINSDNVIATVLMIAGSSFLTNKGIQIASRLRK